MTSPKVAASSKCSKFDEPIRIKIDCLIPDQTVTLVLTVKHRLYIFGSYAHYKANSRGTISLENEKSHGGSYTEVEPMGLFWFMKPLPGQRKGIRFAPSPAHIPSDFTLHVCDGWIEAWSDTTKPHLYQSLKPICKTEFQRILMDPLKIHRTPLEGAPVQGVLFTPKGPPPEHGFPTLIDMYGIGVGLTEHRAGLLASHGFAVLALAYMMIKDLPKKPTDIKFEYFEAAIEWLSSQPGLCSDNIGIIGTSNGACIALNMACVSSKISAVVGINPFMMMDPFNPVTHRGDRLPNLTLPSFCVRYALRWLTQRLVSERLGDYFLQSYLFPVESCRAKFLIHSSELDGLFNSVDAAAALVAKMDAYGQSNRVKNRVYKDAGHLLEPPFFPFVEMVEHIFKSGYMYFGGLPVPHVRAQSRAWEETLQFFKQNVGYQINFDLSELEVI